MSKISKPKKRYILLLIVSTGLLTINSGKQDTAEETPGNRGDVRIMFYNVENYFDTIDNPLTKDEEFTPDGNRYWTPYKYFAKAKKIYKVIATLGKWNPPEIIGLCEIENKEVLKEIAYKTPLIKFEYGIVHKDSPDWRGIDVGMLYNKKKVTIIKKHFININFPFDPEKTTRDILHATCRISQDTLHIFINHWPSRYGGRLQSEPKRMYVATLLKKTIDSIQMANPRAKIVVMGDFNDEPENESITKGLRVVNDLNKIEPNKLYNLSSLIQQKSNEGSYKYKGNWNILDQIIVNGNLLVINKGLSTSPENANIFSEEFLLEEDKQHFGYKPFRTYLGYRYNKGYSDHLPIYLDLNQK
jgi:predicted extracellular nuclease